MHEDQARREGDKIGRYVVISRVAAPGEIWLYNATDSISVSGGTKVIIREAVTEKMLAAFEALKDCQGFLVRDTFSTDGKHYVVFSAPDIKPYSASIGKLSAEELKSQLLLLLPDLEKMHALGLVHGALSAATISQMKNGYPGILGLEQASFDQSPATDIRMLSAYCQQLLSDEAKDNKSSLMAAIQAGLGRGDAPSIASFTEFRKAIFNKKPAEILSFNPSTGAGVRTIGAAAVCALSISLAALTLQNHSPNSVSIDTIPDFSIIPAATPTAPGQIDVQSDAVSVSESSVIQPLKPFVTPMTLDVQSSPSAPMQQVKTKTMSAPQVATIRPPPLRVKTSPNPPSVMRAPDATLPPEHAFAPDLILSEAPAIRSSAPASSAMHETRRIELPARDVDSQPTQERTPFPRLPQPSEIATNQTTTSLVPINVPVGHIKDCVECPMLVVISNNSTRQGFAIGRTEVTLEEFETFLRETNQWPLDTDTDLYQEKLRDRSPFELGFNQTGLHPATHISYEDAEAYVSWLSARTGQTYRLPTRDEWLHAALQGKSTRYVWGNRKRHQCKFANGADATLREMLPLKPAGWCKDSYEATAPVASFQPNELGLFDMSGNLAEWVSECSRPLHSKIACTVGGSWSSTPESLEIKSYEMEHIETRANTIGIRVIRDL